MLLLKKLYNVNLLRNRKEGHELVEHLALYLIISEVLKNTLFVIQGKRGVLRVIRIQTYKFRNARKCSVEGWRIPMIDHRFKRRLRGSCLQKSTCVRQAESCLSFVVNAFNQDFILSNYT